MFEAESQKIKVLANYHEACIDALGYEPASSSSKHRVIHRNTTSYLPTESGMVCQIKEAYSKLLQLKICLP